LFRFASLQSEAAKTIMEKFNYDSSSLDTFVLIADNKLYTKSTAALLVGKKLKIPIKIIYLLIVLPKFLRDFIYDLTAKHRYKIFGRQDVCYILEDGNEKFLE